MDTVKRHVSHVFDKLEVSEQPYPGRGQGAQPRFAGLVRQTSVCWASPAIPQKGTWQPLPTAIILSRTMLSNSFLRLKSLDIEIPR
jgi:hypothetical protein